MKKIRTAAVCLEALEYVVPTVIYDIFTGSYPPRVQVRFFLNSLPFVYFEYPTRSYSAFFILAAKGSCMHLLVSTHNSVSNK